jgi:hypothetical protein
MSAVDRKQAEADAVEHLDKAHKAMKKAAGQNKVKELYAFEILDILRRLRGDHGAA